MTDQMDILLCGDQVSGSHAYLRSQLLSGRTNHILNFFFQQVNFALRREIAQLSPLEVKHIPPFSTLEELVNRDSSQYNHNVAIEGALLCISQLAHYMEYANALHRHPAETETHAVGLSTGLLAAAAIALSPAVPALIPLGVEVVLIAFRTGLHVGTVANHLGSQHDGSSWAYALSKITEAETRLLLSSFHAEQNIPKANNAYISAYSNNSVTISGPPSTLRQLFESSFLQGISREATGAHGPYHASHLHHFVDVEKILRPSSPQAAELLSQYALAFPVLSTSKGSWFPKNSSANDILAAVVADILTEVLNVGEVLDRSAEKVMELKSSRCKIISSGPADLQMKFANAVKFVTEADVTFHDDHTHIAMPKYLDQSPSNSRRPRLAIVGMAGRFPNAADHSKFWDLLESGLDVHRKIPKDRFDAMTYYDPTGKIRNTSHTPYGCFIDEPGLFDPQFFNMSPREAKQTDPMHRLGLTSAYEALEMAGYVPNRTPSTRLDRIGTFFGQTSDDWREINAAQDVDTYFITGGVRAFAPGRINYFFKFTGPSFSVDTACSSSMAAIQLACTSLWAEDCDTAVVGGLNVMTNSDIFAGLSRGQFLSKTGNCQTFDNDADGYCRGDAVGTLIVKRLADAEADNDRILAVILDTATNHSANAVSITHPHAETQEILFASVLERAGIDPHDVNYVEMHGTGTQAGDGTEMRSVTNVFAPVSRKGTRQKPLHLGSVKANVGHGEASSGVTALIKCLLMMQNNRIPPHCGIKKTINQTFPQDLHARNVHIAFKSTPLVSPDGSPRRIFVNNFSAAGGNTAMLLEDAPSKFITRTDPRSNFVIAVSAKSKVSLRTNLRQLIKFIDSHSSVSLADLAYTTTARRIHHNFRVAFSCDKLEMAREILASKLDDSIDPVQSAKPKVAFVFTGQGAHYKFLAKSLYESSTQFRSDILSFVNIAESQGFPSFLPLLLSDTDLKDASPLVMQVGLCCIQMALTRLWATWGVQPDIVMGHSLGEYAALNAAGVISISEAIFLVGERAKLLKQKCVVGSHAMLATKTSAQSAKEALAHVVAYANGVEIACINAPQETVLGGTVADIDKATDELREKGIKCTKLNVQFAFHSAQVDPILTPFQKLAGSIVFQKAKIPVISPLLSGVLKESDSIDKEYLSKHARGTVDFLGALEAAKQLGVINENTLWLELGPHPICSGLIKSGLGQSTKVAGSSLHRNLDDYKVVSDTLAFLHTAGIDINWNGYHRNFQDNLQMLDLPAYAFDVKKYWIDYTGDWNLTKGQTGHLAILPAAVTPSLSTTTVQRVISEVIEDDKLKATMVIESDVSRPDLLAAISGHLVNGTALCPSSIYADMALTVSDYLYKVLQPESDVSMNVCNMEVFKPFIADTSGETKQVLRLTTKLDLVLGRADLLYTSGTGKTEVEHAKCHVKFGQASAWLSEWQRSSYLINGRIDSLRKSAAAGDAHTILRRMAYKLFAALVDYDEKFRGMKEVILDSPQLEATSKVVFQAKESDGTFFCSPYWIDSVSHLAGFVVNANDELDSGKQVYISHGWESMRFAEPLSAIKTYHSYVKMQAAEGSIMLGDVYVFDCDRIIGVVGGLKFQCIPRSLLNTFLPLKGAAAVSKPALASKKQTPKMSKSGKKAVKISSQSPLRPSITSRAFTIIATEIGIEVNELTDNTEFAGMGVDSLLSLAITGRFREELEIEVQSSLFMDYPTVSVMKQFLSRFHTTEIGDLADDSSAGNTTPSLDSYAESTPGGSSSAPTSPSSRGEPDCLSNLLRETISYEMGVDVAEILAAADLTSLGMDSLMSLSILGSLREKTGMSLPSTLLLDNPNIAAIEKSLQIPPVELPPKSDASSLLEGVRNSPKICTPERAATSVLLQGNPRISTKTFWLVPDGSGSATSYIFMPDISRDIAVWGLNSPYMKTPEEYHCGVVGMATFFIKEIKRRQPYGPYNIGGWSAGGVIAFEIVRQMTEVDDICEVLCLIDTPCPLIIEPLPSSLHRFFGSIGLLGEGDGAIEKLPVWLLPHFAASVTALSTYTAQKIDPAKTPKVFTIWCEDGVCKYPEDPRPHPYPYGHAQWLLENRVDFGPNLWDEYLDRAKIFPRHMTGNHFSMMREPYVKRLTEFLREALL